MKSGCWHEGIAWRKKPLNFIYPIMIFELRPRSVREKLKRVNQLLRDTLLDEE